MVVVVVVVVAVMMVVVVVVLVQHDEELVRHRPRSKEGVKARTRGTPSPPAFLALAILAQYDHI